MTENIYGWGGVVELLIFVHKIYRKKISSLNERGIILFLKNILICFPGLYM
jgi:hypothetical protein